MASTYKTPGVYIKEISKFPPSIAQVETAIPAFIGYTEKAELNTNKEYYLNKPVRIKSLADYTAIFGGPHEEPFTITVDADGEVNALHGDGSISLTYRMYYTLQLYFANGGGPCYIVSVGLYADNPKIELPNLEKGLAEIKKEDEPTLILFPDAIAIDGADEETKMGNFYGIYQLALAQCNDLGDRFALIDIYGEDVETFRDKIGSINLKYGAAYHPWLNTTISYHYNGEKIEIAANHLPNSNAPGYLRTGDAKKVDENETDDEYKARLDKSLYHSNTELFHKIRKKLEAFKVVLPPSGVLAGIYAQVDRTRGVWKAPANVSLTGVGSLTKIIDGIDQDSLNIDTTGKSINAIRAFTGKGILVWGARTLAGNDNEWRYVSVRRFFNMAEESIKKGTEAFVFEPNDRNTWTKVRGMIENFLLLQWRAGALQGPTPEDAFFVKVGLPETMTPLDILEGRMVVEIGMAVVRPAEFIILRFSHKMQES